MQVIPGPSAAETGGSGIQAQAGQFSNLGHTTTQKNENGQECISV